MKRAALGARDRFIIEALSRPGWAEKRLWPRIGVDAKNGCWTWTGALSSGYSVVTVPVIERATYTNALVHRVVWIALRGEIESGLVLDHDGPTGCHTRSCPNPDHLQVVTVRHNTIITGTGPTARNARKTMCPQGHLLEGDNLTARHDGGRNCRACQRMHDGLRRLAARTLGLRLGDYVAEHGYTIREAGRVIAEARLAVAA